jgi:hypothetical protein
VRNELSAVLIAEEHVVLQHVGGLVALKEAKAPYERSALLTERVKSLLQKGGLLSKTRGV